MYKNSSHSERRVIFKDAVTDLLRFRRKVEQDAPNNFGVQTSEGIISNFRSITAGVALAMIVISSIGLMIGGIGVMNIMLVSVAIFRFS